MRRHEPLDDDEARRHLAAQVDRIEHAIADLPQLRANLDATNRGLADLADWMRRLATATSNANSGNGSDVSGGSASDQTDDAAVVPEWLTVTDPQLAVSWLQDLDRWVRDVWSRYHELPGCWPWHPEVVAELLANRISWATATTPGAAPDALSNWHDRWRPGAAHRISRFMTACDRAFGRHVGEHSTRWHFDTSGLDEVAVWWATSRSTSPAPGLVQDTTRY